MYTTVLPQLHALDWGNKRGAWQRHRNAAARNDPYHTLHTESA